MGWLALWVEWSEEILARLRPSSGTSADSVMKRRSLGATILSLLAYDWLSRSLISSSSSSELSSEVKFTSEASLRTSYDLSSFERMGDVALSYLDWLAVLASEKFED